MASHQYLFTRGKGCGEVWEKIKTLIPEGKGIGEISRVVSLVLGEGWRMELLAVPQFLFGGGEGVCYRVYIPAEEREVVVPFSCWGKRGAHREKKKEGPFSLRGAEGGEDRGREEAGRPRFGRTSVVGGRRGS